MALLMLAIVFQHAGVGFQVTVDEQYVVRDNHRGLNGGQRNPVVGGVEAVGCDHALQPRVIRDAKRGIANHAHLGAEMLGDFCRFRL